MLSEVAAALTHFWRRWSETGGNCSLTVTQAELYKGSRIADPEGIEVIYRKDNQLLCVSHHQPRGEQFLQSTSTSCSGYWCMDLIVVQLMRTLYSCSACRYSLLISG